MINDKGSEFSLDFTQSILAGIVAKLDKKNPEETEQHELSSSHSRTSTRLEPTCMLPDRTNVPSKFFQ